MSFETRFHLSRYNFRLPRYRRVKERVISGRLLSPSLSLTRTSRSHLAHTDLSQIADKRQTEFLEKRITFPGKISRSVGRIRNARAMLSVMETLKRCSSVTDRDIGIKQKAI